ncbi:hypothetical protein [Alicyclobacillus dauci]|uniref:Uncharacterized protein n=1 Tax=Alicyclobacillus dauci TaxID=1475485 RepID=A0ABY6Z3X3_9BACL|nr:hypothetical protein [Alicyclobacillus dauci]WAH37450.1 hypothetical protein NZD86_02615 [Alicyclobacillus dauci]
MFDWEKQQWMLEAWETLLLGNEVHLEPTEVAARLLYLVGGRDSVFNREISMSSLPDPTVLPTLLQHARGSLSEKRTLHLSFLLSTLYEHGIPMLEFVAVNVPQSFLDSLRKEAVRKVDELSCQAPWCNGFQLRGTLVKTGTTVKRRKSGEVLLYYLACLKCGCEYALDEQGELKERTYFISGHKLLRQLSPQILGLKDMARQTGMTEDKIRRCLAYFCTRQGTGTFAEPSSIISSKLVRRFLDEVRAGSKLKSNGNMSSS